MTGGTIDHNRITLNVADALRQRLSDGNCEAFVNDMKVVTPAGDVMYPDVVVACGDIPGKATLLEAPMVIVEVLSESTAERDHGREGPTRRSRLFATMSSWTRTRAGSR